MRAYNWLHTITVAALPPPPVAGLAGLAGLPVAIQAQALPIGTNPTNPPMILRRGVKMRQLAGLPTQEALVTVLGLFATATETAIAAEAGAAIAAPSPRSATGTAPVAPIVPIRPNRLQLLKRVIL